MNRLIPATLAALAILIPPATAGEVADMAASAEQQAAKGDHGAAIQTMRKALLKVWSQSKLGVNNPNFVARKASGYGIFDARPDNVFKQGEKILVYVEPVGYKWNQENGIYRSNLTADVQLKSADGKVLGGQEGFGQFNLASRVQNTEYYISLTYSFTGVAPGKYIVGTILHDKIGGSSTSFDLPFEIK